jgi:Raf kinase inhibitor-like YbhB/YbcL family protein
MNNINDTDLIIYSEAFHQDEPIPSKYTCEGENINPPLRIENIPLGTASLALIMEDPDAPKGTFDHWLVWNIPPDNINIEEDSLPGINGTNSAGKTGYHGPCPPNGSHRYYFHVFALEKELDLQAGAVRKDLEAAMKPYILAQGSLMGRYELVNKEKAAVK